MHQLLKLYVANTQIIESKQIMKYFLLLSFLPLKKQNEKVSTQFTPIKWWFVFSI